MLEGKPSLQRGDDDDCDNRGEQLVFGLKMPGIEREERGERLAYL